MSRILIAEDEPRIAAFVEKGLSANGFAVTVPAADPTLRFLAKYGAELGYDYGYVVVSTDGGSFGGLGALRFVERSTFRDRVVDDRPEQERARALIRLRLVEAVEVEEQPVGAGEQRMADRHDPLAEA